MSVSEIEFVDCKEEPDVVESAGNASPDILESVNNVAANTLPQRSREKYESVYEKFMQWKKTRKTTSFSEHVLMAYFIELSKNLKPSTLWSHYSMLKSTIGAKHKVDMSTYARLSAFLKRQATGYHGKKSKVLTSNDVENFLNNAPDNQYLATKVALVLGVTGACRREELCNLTIKDIDDNGSMALIVIRRSKTNKLRSFTVVGEFYNIFKRYAVLRPKNVMSNRFFLNYQNGKCTQQVIGINKFGGMPKQIASYLNLPEPETYTGHSFRRTSVTLLANAGADITTLKRHGGWRSNRVAEEYIKDSLNKKTKICEQIAETVHLRPSTSSFRNSHVNSTFAPPSPKKEVLDEIEVNNGASTVDAESDITMKQQGEWRSNPAAEEYTKDSLNNKSKTCEQIAESAHSRPSISSSDSSEVDSPSAPPSPQKEKDREDEFEVNHGASASTNNPESSTSSTPTSLNFNHCSNVTINLSCSNVTISLLLKNA
ncbi:uncharacterized protein [Neodiprion pinetum]|uniref:Uncharacterized protein LOC107226689 n=1 Tax=Neodiprion lecontei TaxID=441921 RepID=A0A6J0C912_NEOLC|nr:uncharacterized protein LOC107226689 [Neodiprion lecontei]XP_046481986.1 uncharacterized protein LOC124218998 [Neodiprion pinetum]